MDTASLSPASHLLGAILMFIGGSPASAAGGVKTVSLAVLMLEIWATLRGRPNVEAFGRTIPDEVVRRAAVIIVLMMALISAVTLLLCFTEGSPLLVSLFETVSAAGTVGLSTGLTPELTPSGRTLIMITMFVGRLGPVTMLVALTGRAKPVRFAYPPEHVSIG
jgi:trk system potassium uptake protein TrkH